MHIPNFVIKVPIKLIATKPLVIFLSVNNVIKPPKSDKECAITKIFFF